MRVPSQQPSVDPGTVRLAIIGEAPALEEETWRHCVRGHQFPGQHWKLGQIVVQDTCPACGTSEWTSHPTPFVGPSGRLLDHCLQRAGFSRERCFIGNVSFYPRSAAEMEGGGKLAQDLAELSDELVAFNPNCVLVLGNTALRVFHPWHWRPPTSGDASQPTKAEPAVLKLEGEDEAPKPTKKPRKPRGDFALKITDWRGSIFQGELRAGGWSGKCVAAYHPAAILRSSGPGGGPGSNPEWLPLLRFDVKRAVQEAHYSGLQLTQHWIQKYDQASQVVEYLSWLRGQHSPCGHDIEGTALSGVTDCSFAISPLSIYWVPLKKIDGTPWWSPAEQQAIMEALQAILEDPTVPKVVHNGLYEAFVWKWAHGITLRGVVGDTMMLWHELQPELDKSLDVPASILTRQPYWKWGLWAETEEARAEYNCTDSGVTLNLHQITLPLLTPGQRSHYNFNVSLLEPMADQMLRGIRFDVEAREQLVAALRQEIVELQGELDVVGGVGPPTVAEVAPIVCWKKHLGAVKTWDDVAFCAKPSWKEEAPTTPFAEEKDADSPF